MMKREELSRIASVKFQKALSDRARAVTPRVLAFCVMAVSLVFTLAVTAANLRLTYVTDSDGARQLVVSSETDPARVMSLSGIEAEEGDHVYYTAFSGNLATLNIERAGLQGLLVDFIKVQGFLFCQLILVCKCAYLRSFSRIRKNYVQIHIPKADHFA